MNPLLIVGIIAGVLLVGLGVQTKRVESCKAESAEFIAKVEAAGIVAQKVAAAKEKEDAKRITDALTDRDTALKRLRLSASRGNVPILSSGPSGSGEICGEQKALSAAIERFRGGVRSLVESGDEAQIDAQSLVRSWPLKMTVSLQ